MTTLASRAQLRASFIRWALFLVPGVVLLGFLASQFAGSGQGDPWFAALDKPGIYPGAGVFPIVWGVLYAMIGFAFAMVCAAWGARGRVLAIAAFLVQLLLNLAWPALFFGEHRIAFAFYLIVALAVAIVVTIALFWRVRRGAALLLLPYLAWVLFAGYLNYEIMRMNPVADGAETTGAVQRYEL